MDWLEEAALRQKRKNQIYFTKKSACLLPLSAQLQGQSRRTVVLWALSFAEEAADLLLCRYPSDFRPGKAVQAAKGWADGQLKMPEARRAILAVHQMAKEVPSAEDSALCHAVGQACSTVHTAGHALGFPLYELTAITLRHGILNARRPVEARILDYEARLSEAQRESSDPHRSWAPFLLP